MKTLILSFLLMGVSASLSAQAGSFGILKYTVPDGFELSKKEDVLTYLKQDKNTGAYCLLFIYNIVSSQESIQENFTTSWNKIVQQNITVGTAPEMQPEAEIKGWKFLIGSATYPEKGINNLAMLTTFTGENKMQNVFILTNSQSFTKNIEEFIASVDVNNPAKASAQKKSTPKNTVAASSNNGKNIKYEVWECNCPNLATGIQVTTKLNTVVISPDRKYLTYMPEKGLNGIKPENSNETDSWGNVTDKGNMLSLFNEKYGKMELYKIDASSMSRYPNSKSSIYKKVKPVDGLRFEGAYSPELAYYNGKTDIISKQIDPNKRPIIFFKKDGTYINEGLTFSNITLGDDFAIGKGTYEVSNYSLILTTQSGKILQVAFTPVLDANPSGADNPGFIINNSLCYRLNKQYVPKN